MKKLKHWLYRHFLPIWCREELLEENRQLFEALKKEQRRREIAESYAKGLYDGIRRLGVRRTERRDGN